MTKYNQSVWLILLNVSLHYCRFNVSMNVARTPKSMKKGSQVLRNAAQLKDTERVVCVRVIINTWISWVCVCSSGGIFLDRQGHARCVGSITWSNLSTPRGPQPPQSSPPRERTPACMLCPFCPADTRSPTGEVTFCCDTEGERRCQWWITWLPFFLKRLLCRRSVCAEAAQTVMPALSMWVSRE